MKSAVNSYCFKWSTTVGLGALIIYILIEQFYALWWIVFIVPALMMILLLIVSFFSGIVFWIIRRDEFQYAYLPLLVNIAIISVIISQPGTDHNKRYHKRMINLCQQKGSNIACSKDLYLDYYCVYGGGATATDVVAVYLTDVKTFRLFLGTYSEGEGWINASVKGDSIAVKNIQKTELLAKKDIPADHVDSTNTWGVKYQLNVKQNGYSLQQLKRRHVFE